MVNIDELQKRIAVLSNRANTLRSQMNMLMASRRGNTDQYKEMEDNWAETRAELLLKQQKYNDMMGIKPADTMDSKIDSSMFGRGIRLV